jgi:hypothetical protein
VNRDWEPEPYELPLVEGPPREAPRDSDRPLVPGYDDDEADSPPGVIVIDLA